MSKELDDLVRALGGGSDDDDDRPTEIDSPWGFVMIIIVTASLFVFLL